MQEEQSMNKQEAIQQATAPAPLGQVERLVGLNGSGVKLIQKNSHAYAKNAICVCGSKLVVAPLIMGPVHEEGNPIMVCEDHAIHAAWFKDLIVGKQTTDIMQRTCDFK